MIKDTIGGDLSTDSVARILDLDSGGLSTATGDSNVVDSDAYNRKYNELRGIEESFECHGSLTCFRQAYSREEASSRAYAYTEQILAGKSDTYADVYSRQLVNVRRPERYAHAVAREIDAGKSYAYAYPYIEEIAAGKSDDYARTWAQAYDDGHTAGLPSKTDRDTFARAYAGQILAGKADSYADAYSRQLVVDSKPEEYAHGEQIANGKSEEYAHRYAAQV